MEINKLMPPWWYNWNKSNSIEWIFRIVFSLAFIETACVIQEEHYLDTCWLLLFISIWLYFFKQKILALIPIIFALLIHYVHYNMGY